MPCHLTNLQFLIVKKCQRDSHLNLCCLRVSSTVVTQVPEMCDNGSPETMQLP
jgi:hypothetical protein